MVPTQSDATFHRWNVALLGHALSIQEPEGTSRCASERSVHLGSDEDQHWRKPALLRETRSQNTRVRGWYGDVEAELVHLDLIPLWAVSSDLRGSGVGTALATGGRASFVQSCWWDLWRLMADRHPSSILENKGLGRVFLFQAPVDTMLTQIDRHPTFQQLMSRSALSSTARNGNVSMRRFVRTTCFVEDTGLQGVYIYIYIPLPGSGMQKWRFSFEWFRYGPDRLTS